MGISRVRAAGLEVIVISLEANPVVSARCRKLNVECVQDCKDKLSALRAMVASRGLSVEAIAFVGNDVNDVECLKWVGLPIVVADAEPAVLPHARLVTTRLGGRGAVREVCDMLEFARVPG